MLSAVDKNLILERFARGRESKLVDSYIAVGPAEVRESLGLTDEEWTVVFDYLVFEYNLLYKTVAQASEFFLDNFVKHGMTHVKEILAITDSKYDAVWEVVFDFLAISNEGLYLHVLQNRERYVVAFKARGGDFVRRVLGVWKAKYEENWAKILDLLLNALCDSLFSERNFDEGLRTFSRMMNSARVHRSIVSHRLYLDGVL